MGLWGSIKDRVKKLFTIPGTSAANAAAATAASQQLKAGDLFENWRAEREQYKLPYSMMEGKTADALRGIAWGLDTPYSQMSPTAQAWYKVQSPYEAGEGTALPEVYRAAELPGMYSYGSLPETYRAGELPGMYSYGALPEAYKGTALPEMYASNEAWTPGEETLAALRAGASPEAVEERVRRAHGTLSSLDINKIAAERAAAAKANTQRRGLRGASYYAYDLAPLQNWQRTEGGRLAAQGELAAIGAGNTAREMQRAGLLSAEDLLRTTNVDEYERGRQTWQDTMSRSGEEYARGRQGYLDELDLSRENADRARQQYLDLMNRDATTYERGQQGYRDDLEKAKLDYERTRQSYLDEVAKSEREYGRGRQEYLDEADRAQQIYGRERESYEDEARRIEQSRANTANALAVAIAERDRLQELSSTLPVVQQQGQLTADALAAYNAAQDRVASNRANIINALTGVGQLAAQWFKKKPAATK